MGRPAPSPADLGIFRQVEQPAARFAEDQPFAPKLVVHLVCNHLIAALADFPPVDLFDRCHRVIAANRTLNGFGGGLRRKRWLLRHEGASFRDDAPEQLRLL